MPLPTDYQTGQLIDSLDINSWTSAINANITRTVVLVTGVATLDNTESTDYVALIGPDGVCSLPDAATVGINRYTVKNVDSVSHAVSTTSEQTIDESASVLLSPNQSIDVISDGANWVVI